MAIGVHKDNIYEYWDIPLIGGQNDHEWRDNSWLSEHLRQLADKIDNESPRIYSISLETDCNYKIPHLNIKTFKDHTPVVICQNCKSFWITPIKKCNECGSTSFNETHRSNIEFAKNKKIRDRIKKYEIAITKEKSRLESYKKVPDLYPKKIKEIEDCIKSLNETLSLLKRDDIK